MQIHAFDVELQHERCIRWRKLLKSKRVRLLQDGANVLVERHLFDQRTANVLRTVVLHFRINSTHTHTFAVTEIAILTEATAEVVRFTERPAKLFYQRTNSPTRSVARTISSTGFSVSRGNAHCVNFDSCSCITQSDRESSS